MVWMSSDLAKVPTNCFNFFWRRERLNGLMFQGRIYLFKLVHTSRLALDTPMGRGDESPRPREVTG